MNPKQNKERKIKAWALVNKKTGKICRMMFHVLITDNPYCIYKTKDFLEGDKDTEKIPC